MAGIRAAGLWSSQPVTLDILEILRSADILSMHQEADSSRAEPGRQLRKIGPLSLPVFVPAGA